jgi:hypothetical protein
VIDDALIPQARTRIHDSQRYAVMFGTMRALRVTAIATIAT